jgi:hypothetical protein
MKYGIISITLRYSIKQELMAFRIGLDKLELQKLRAPILMSWGFRWIKSTKPY